MLSRDAGMDSDAQETVQLGREVVGPDTKVIKCR